MKAAVSAAAAGFAAMTAQLLLTRELMVVGRGDEIGIGLVFFAWLLWVGIGSAAGGAFVKHRRPTSGDVGALLIMLGALLPPSVIWARAQGPLFGYIRGELVPVEHLLLMALAALAPVCLIAGFLYPVLCGVSERPPAKGAAGRIYALDTLGAVAGGLAFSFIIINMMGPVACSLAAGTVAVFIGAAWLPRAVRLPVWLLLVVGAATSPIWLGSASLVARTLAWGRPVVESVESGYGNITVLKDENQYSFFTNGRVAGVEPDIVFGEYMAHVPLLAHSAPKSALFIGASATTISEALKHGLERVVWAELDPKLINVRKRYTPGGLKSIYDDPRVKIVAGDPRRFLARYGERLDVIVVNTPPPENIVLNRYYTREAFEMMFARLAGADGVLAVTVPFKENYMSASEKALLGTIYKTLVWARAKDIAGQVNHPRFVIGPRPLLIYGSENILNTPPRLAAERFSQRKIISDHFGAETAWYYFDPARTEAALMQFSDDPIGFINATDKVYMAVEGLLSAPGVTVNRDFIPGAVYLNLRYSSSYYRSSRIPALLRAISSLKSAEESMTVAVIPVAVLFVAAFILIVAGRRWKAGRAAAAFTGTVAVGLAGMTIEIVLLLVFQISFGVVYQYIGLLTAAFLGGTAAGAGWVSRGRALKASPRDRPEVAAVLCLAFSALILIPVLPYAVSRNGVIVAAITVTAAVLTGVTVGAFFPLVIRWSGHAGQSAEAPAAGFLYFADLLGACAGALITGIVLVPLAGITGALVVAAVFALLAGAAMAAVPSS